MTQIEELNDKEFELFQKFIFKQIGISLPNSKKFLVKNRLFKRLLEYNLNSYSDYYRLIQINEKEQTVMLNLITTNETYFFREAKHFEFLQNEIIPKYKNKKLRIWSAASSVGAEAYTIAMILNESLKSFEILGSDINSEVIKKANVGLYPLKWMDKIPSKLRQKYCLKGKGKHEGWFLIDRVLLQNMQFNIRNLMHPQNDIGQFDVIFLRNVLIYFDKETKIKIINNILNNLKPGGYFFISFTEHIHDLNIKNLEQVESSIFKKVENG
jgi:chemotaxis protein methyltransferase CheR